MTVEEIEAYIKKISKRGSILGLESIRRLCELLTEAYPEKGKLLQDRIPAIHIAGTNGKGSVGAMLSAIYQEAGFRVGHFSSPAVFQYEEMFRINGRPIEKIRLAELYTEVEKACGRMEEENRPHPTIFELETAAAFLYFWQEGCQITIMECGMGGAEDATNVMTHPLACLISSIGMDHTKFLGEREEEIAEVKAGILVDQAPLISAAQKKSVSDLLRKKAKEMGSAFYQVEAAEIRKPSFSFKEEGIVQEFSYKGLKLELPLAGGWQLENAALAVETVRAVNQRKEGEAYHLTDEVIEAGIKKTSWSGRLQKLGRLPRGADLYIDGAHNPAAAGKLRESIQLYFKGKKLIFIMGVLADKDFHEVLKETMPLGERLFTIQPDNPRALSAEELAKAAEPYMEKVKAEGTVGEALWEADQTADPETIVLAFGSLSYLGEVKDAFTELKKEKMSCR